LHEISYTKERVVWLINTKLIRSGGIAYHDDKEEVAEDVPVKVIEIWRIGVKQLTDDRCCILNQRIACHNVEKREIGG
jgi:hypothetical protein